MQAIQIILDHHIFHCRQWLGDYRLYLDWIQEILDAEFYY